MANIHLYILAVLVVASYYKGLPAKHGYRMRTTKSMAHRTMVRRLWEPQIQKNIARQRELNAEEEVARLKQLAEEAILAAKGIKKKRKVVYRESLYEPYWVGGEWVFYRTTGVLKKKYTKPPTTTTPWSSTTSTTTESTITRGSITTPYVNYMCQHPCLEIFEDFGVVCGQRYNGRWYEQKQFDDACDLLNANCMDPRSNYDRWMWYRGPWYILYRGPCWNLTTPWPFPPTNMTALFSRNRFYVSQVMYNKDRDLNWVRVRNLNDTDILESPTVER